MNLKSKGNFFILLLEIKLSILIFDPEGEILPY